MKKPILVPPCSGWKEDFHPPFTSSNVAPSPTLLSANYQDDTYLEVSRHSISAREILFVLALATIPVLILITYAVVDSAIYSLYNLMLAGILTLLAGIWQTTLFLRAASMPPRDEPIRFNRARQKIYAYNFNFCWWNPFIPWPIKIVSYDWKDVRAERWRKQAVTHQGSHLVKTGIMLSIVEPGTNNVIDRFPLNNLYGEASIWAYICTYMQHGVSAVPPAPLNRDHNDLLWCQFAMRLAPEVKWPEVIDHESRTSPQSVPPVKVALS
ncbi:DUF6708 domain-containing protein [Pseudomonas sp. BW16M2]|uniref:DUF6708 domain-containing protein n=1 Tax=Pseudomonas sp. BW16M2 TaxID=2745489 RepID=UPI001EE1E852|nr:DUF6708 domain-containing protein [Pseudomonas sp. BW16M2]